MSRSATPGQPVVIRAGCYDYSASKEMQQITCNGSVVILSGTSDALQYPGNTQIQAAGVDAMTLASPLSGEQPIGDDGKTLFLVDLNGAAHTVTAATNKIAPSHHLLTFNGTIGSNVTLRAISGLWVVVASTGVTAS